MKLKIMLNLLAIITFLISSNILSKEKNIYPQKEWTILLYYSGDNNLTNFLTESVKQIKQSRSKTDNLHIVLQFDGNQPNDSYREYIQITDSGTISTRIEKGIEYDMGDESTLINFVQWGIKTFPSRKIGLVINGHGRGVVNLRSDDDSFKGESKNNLKMVSSPDDSSESFFDESKLVAGLKNTLNGKKIDLIVFSACLMGSFEVLAEYSSVAKYITASEDLIYVDKKYFETELGVGVAIHKIPSIIESTSNITAEGLGKGLVDEYYNSYVTFKVTSDFNKNIKNKMRYTLATFDLSKIAKVKKQLSLAIMDILAIAQIDNKIFDQLYKQFFSYPKIHMMGFLDIGVIASALYNISGSANCKALLELVYSDELVRSKTLLNIETYLAGVTLFMPYDFYSPMLPRLNSVMKDYKQLTWSENNIYTTFINNYLTHIKETKLEILEGMIDNLVNNGIREVTRFKSDYINDLHLFRAYEAALGAVTGSKKQAVLNRYFKMIEKSKYSSSLFIKHKKWIKSIIIK